MVKVSSTPIGFIIEFPRDAEILASLRAELRGAMYQPLNRNWLLPVKTNHRREHVEAWASEWNLRLSERAGAKQAALDAARAQGRAHEIDPAAALAFRAEEIEAENARIESGTLSYAFKYDPECVAIAKSMPGHRFVDGTWQWVARSVEDVATLIQGVNRIHRHLEEKQRCRRAGAKGPDGRLRHLVRATEAVQVGTELEIGEELFVVESLGRAFPVGRKAAQTGSGITAGEIGRYLYCRAAIASVVARGPAATSADVRPAFQRR